MLLGDLLPKLSVVLSKIDGLFLEVDKMLAKESIGLDIGGIREGFGQFEEEGINEILLKEVDFLVDKIRDDIGSFDGIG